MSENKYNKNYAHSFKGFACSCQWKTAHYL